MRRLRKDAKGDEPVALSHKDIDDILSDAAFWEAQREIFIEAIGTIPDEILQQGIEAARSLGLAIDFDLANAAVLRFTRTYINDWWRGLHRTQRNVLRAALRAHIATGGTMEALAKKIAPLFGESRAMAIAVTETTRLFAQGNLEAYRTSGVTHVQWQTVRDSRVDPACEALDGKRWKIESVGETPPLHVRCRCDLLPIVGGPKGRVLRARVQEG